MAITAATIKELAHQCGFEIAGVAAALPNEDFERFQEWRAAGHAADMGYLADHRGDLRGDPRYLLPAAQSIVCVGMLYNTSYSYSNQLTEAASQGWISRYAWGQDYHQVMRAALEQLERCIAEVHGQRFQSKLCVDTAPLLERSYARAAGLGWIGKNTCLINQQQGSWFFLGELLISIPLTADFPAPERCGSCRRCIDACPTDAIVLNEKAQWTLDSRLCISYLTIEKRGPLPGEFAAQMSNHIFGCDICQDVCPWNRKAAVTDAECFGPAHFSPKLAALADLTEDEFRTLFRDSAIWRTKYEGFLRNVAHALGNSGDPEMSMPLEKLAAHPNPVISATARTALERLQLACS